MTTTNTMPMARRDMLLLVGALAGLVALCWWYLASMAQSMGEMSGNSSMASIGPWTGAHFVMMLGMWVVMMVGMMAPTAVRSVLIFVQVGTRAASRGRPFVSGYWFTAGYLLIWIMFSVVATALQWALDRAALLSPMMVTSSSYLGALLLMSAGLWQFSPVKDTCLRHCQSPATYLATHFRPGPLGAVNLGFRHGMYCLGCCWLLMGLLFVGGVMNLLWIAAITAFVLLEKTVPARLMPARLSGWGMLAASVGYLAWSVVN